MGCSSGVLQPGGSGLGTPHAPLTSTSYVIIPYHPYLKTLSSPFHPKLHLPRNSCIYKTSTAVDIIRSQPTRGNYSSLQPSQHPHQHHACTFEMAGSLHPTITHHHLKPSDSCRGCIDASLMQISLKHSRPS